MKLPEALLFANNAQLACAAGALFLVLAAATRVADRRRTRRQHIDSVGWVPWTGMFLVCAVIGLTLLGLGLPGLFKG